ncbi:MAG: diguanylate cyclase [Oscillospiraceae bacterium]|nr:diguanylate cyclase [Oscillospiraceae bacterium]
MEEKNRILIVDDDTSMLIELASILNQDYKIYTVKDGLSALEKASEVSPDLILLDVIMPDISGFEVLGRLKDNEKTRDIPVLFITGATDSEAEIQGLAAGAVDYVHKPLNESLVKLRVRHQIQLLNQFRKIEHLSMSDQLTGLPNRRSFEMKITEEWDRASRELTPLSVMMVDIDHFKKYNDTYGHQQGDVALKAVADMFARSLRRPSDFVARWGGEEFILLLPNTDSKGAYDVAESIRKHAEDMEIPAADKSITKLTVSIGVNTRVQSQIITLDKFVSWTDMALYTAKNKGRNKVCVYEVPDDENGAQDKETKRSIIFIVDDNKTNLDAAEKVLAKDYRVIALTSAEKMFKALTKFTPDMILLDIEMPEMNGFEAMKKLKSDEIYAEIPVIFLTGLSDAESEAHGIKLGAVDFIMKPFTEPVLINRIRNHLDIDGLVRERTRQLAYRTEQLARRSDQLMKLQNGIVFTLADIVENRDANTGGHIERTSTYMSILIDAMLEQDVYSEELGDWDLDSVISSARLHDIGKISIPDSVLNKPDKLTDEEFAIIQTHPEVGKRMIEQMTERTGEALFLENAKLFAEFHHEKWNGRGYPNGLCELEIPLHGRIMAVIDVYDALVSDRPYKKAFSHEKAVSIIMEDAGTHFDPSIADVFNNINDKIEAAMKRFNA